MFTTNGRIGRLRYLGWSMAMTLCFLVIMGLGFLLGETVGVAVTALASIAFIVIAVMIGVQRLHDLGWSGWLWLLNFVPFVGSVFGILMLVLPGSTGANRYGPPPPANSTGVKVLASLIILLPIVGIIAAIALPSYQGYLERANYDGGASAPADPYTTDEQPPQRRPKPMKPPRRRQRPWKTTTNSSHATPRDGRGPIPRPFRRSLECPVMP